jgi:hypothetical protein
MASTDIVKWRKTNDYEYFDKRNELYKNFEKREEEETKSMPHAPVIYIISR